MVAELKLREIERRLGAATYRFNDRVVPHPAAVEIIGGDEKGRSQPVSSQDRQRHRAVVGIAVVERDGERARRQALLAQTADRIRQRQDIEPMLEERELGVEPGGVWLTGKQGIGLRQYPMEDHHRQSPAVTFPPASQWTCEARF